MAVVILCVLLILSDGAGERDCTLRYLMVREKASGSVTVPLLVTRLVEKM